MKFTAFASPRPIKPPSRVLYQYVATDAMSRKYGSSAGLTTTGSGVYAKRSSFLNTQKRAEMAEKTTPPRMVSALPAADAAQSPTETKSLAQSALQTVVSAPAEMDMMLSSWKSKTCAAPSNTPSLAAREPVRAHTTTTFATLPM